MRLYTKKYKKGRGSHTYRKTPYNYKNWELADVYKATSLVHVCSKHNFIRITNYIFL